MKLKLPLVLLSLSLIFVSIRCGEIIGRACTKDEDCDTPWVVCQPSNECGHKSIFPMETMEFIGTIVVFLIAVFAVAAGIG